MNKIKELRTAKKISQQKLAELLNVHQTAVSQWETDRTTPDIETAKKIAELFGVTLDELLKSESGKLKTERRTGIKIPVIGVSAAGYPIDAEQEYIDPCDSDTWEEISESMARTGDFVAIRIKGDSMEPRITDGDIVIVRIQDIIEDGDTAIVLINGDEATCKRVIKKPNGIMLLSTNQKYEPMFYTAEEIKNLPVRIYGKVVELRAKFE